MADQLTGASVKAVGFAFIKPEVVLLIADKIAYCMHFYPSKFESNVLDFSDTSRPHWVLLKSPSHIGSMAPYIDNIHRLIVFGSPEELISLGLPVLDANVTSSGVEVNRRYNRDEMLSRIDKDAVDIKITETEKIYASLKKREQDKMERKSSGKTFFSQLKALKDSAGKDNAKLFVTQIGVPAVLRLMGDNDRDAFKVVCKLMVDKGWVKDEAARTFFRWVEGFDGEGTELGNAVDALLYPKQDAAERLRNESEWTDELTRSIANKFGVDEEDLLFVARSYAQLLEEHKKTAPPPKIVDDDDGFPVSPDEEEFHPKRSQTEFGDFDEPEDKPEREERSSEEDDLAGSAFGWTDKDGEQEGLENEEKSEKPMFDDDFSDFNN